MRRNRSRHRPRQHSGQYGQRPPWFRNGPWTLPTETQIDTLYRRFAKVATFSERTSMLPGPLRDQLDHYLILVQFCHRYSYFHPLTREVLTPQSTISARRRTECLTLLTQWLLYEHPGGMTIKYQQLDQREKHVTFPFLGPGCSVHNLEAVFEYIEQEAITGRPPPRPRRSISPTLVVTDEEVGRTVEETIAGLFPVGVTLDPADEELISITDQERDVFRRWLYAAEADQPWNEAVNPRGGSGHWEEISPLDVTELTVPNRLSRYYTDYINTLRSCDPNHISYSPNFLTVYGQDLEQECNNLWREVRRRTIRVKKIREYAALIHDVPGDVSTAPDRMEDEELNSFRKRRVKELDIEFPKVWCDYLQALEKSSTHQQMIKWLSRARERHIAYETMEVPRFVGLFNSPVSLFDNSRYLNTEQEPAEDDSDDDDEPYGQLVNEIYYDEAEFADEDQPPR